MKIKFYLSIAILVVLAACQGNGNENEEVAIENNRDKDTVAVVKINPDDTANLESFSVDSLKMCVAFQTAANEFTTGYKMKNVPIYAKYLHPSIVKMNGGIDAFKSKIKTYIAQDTMQFSKMITGPLKRVEAAIDPKGNVTGWYCLMPVRRWPMFGNKREIKVQWLAGQSLDHGKNIYFIDITGVPKEKIYQIMPDYHFLMEKELNR